MIGLAIALMVIGLVFGFVIPWVGIVVGLVGALLFIAFVTGFGRRAARRAPRLGTTNAGARLAPPVVRFSLLNRIGRSSSGAAAGPQPVFRRAPSPGALRRERRAIVKAREERIRHLGGLTLEMYRRSSFRDELLIEQCREIVALEDRLRELDSMLEAVATARRAPATCECGAPVPWGSHFCANCGRPVGAEPVVACEGCGHPLSADAHFCAQCGRPVETSDERAGGRAPSRSRSRAEPKSRPAIDETILHSADPWER